MVDPAAQIAGLVGAIGAMAGFIVWLFRDALGRADAATKSWQSQAESWQKVAETNAASSKDLSSLLSSALDSLKRIEAELREDDRRGDRK